MLKLQTRLTTKIYCPYYYYNNTHTHTHTHVCAHMIKFTDNTLTRSFPENGTLITTLTDNNIH